MWSKKYNWCFETEPDPNMNGRRIYWPRGKTLGGSSAINGLIYIRGQREDFDHWESLGNKGWGYDNLLPYFVRSERNARGEIPLHGADGPLGVSDIADKDELIEAFIQGAGEKGIPRTTDFNGISQEGAGYYQLTTWRGLRCSAAVAYLRPALGRANLTVLTQARVTSLLLENKTAKGVSYLRGGRQCKALAIREVLLCAGAIQSPHILMLSGIGPRKHLEEYGIRVVHDHPGVGQNLQDHLQIRLIYECTKPITTNDDLRSWIGKMKMGLQWILQRKGPLAVGINQGGCFTKTSVAADGRPDIQFHVATLSADMAGGKVHDFSGFTISVCQLRPESRGQILLKSSDPLIPPAIHSNYLSTKFDQDTAIAAVDCARSVLSSDAMRPYIKTEITPGAALKSPEDILGFIRKTGATIFHPSGTCKMGDDSLAVVDQVLRVRGIHGLRIIDCSVMPTLISGNTNAAAIAIGEYAADFIKNHELIFSNFKS
jgi:choline dehydrogenase